MEDKLSLMPGYIAIEVGALHCDIMALCKIHCRTSHCQGCDVHKADIEEPNNCALGFTNKIIMMINDDILSARIFCSSFHDK